MHAPATAPPPSTTSVERTTTTTQQPRLLLHAGQLPHQLLLPRCSLVVHPGGSGTTAAALACGTRQLLAPLHFDQFFWAERLAYLGLSPSPLKRDVLFGRGGDADVRGAKARWGVGM